MNIKGLSVSRVTGSIQIRTGGIVTLSHAETQQLIDYLKEQVPFIVEDSKKQLAQKIDILEDQKKSIEAQIKSLQDEIKTNTTTQNPGNTTTTNSRP